MQVDKNKQDTSCRRSLGTAKMSTAHLTFEQHRCRKSWDTSSECQRGNILAQNQNTSRNILTGGVKQRAPRWHTYYTHIHSISFPTSWFLSHHRTSRWQRGGPQNSSHVYHVSMNAPQTFLSPPFKCTFVPGWNSLKYMITIQQVSWCFCSRCQQAEIRKCSYSLPCDWLPYLRIKW